MTSYPPYIVLEPRMKTNPIAGHVVVHVKEWVAIMLGEKEDYDFVSEHPDYPTAAAERDRLNQRPGEFPPLPSTEQSTDAPKKGVSLERATA